MAILQIKTCIFNLTMSSTNWRICPFPNNARILECFSSHLLLQSLAENDDVVVNLLILYVYALQDIVFVYSQYTFRITTTGTISNSFLHYYVSFLEHLPEEHSLAFCSV